MSITFITESENIRRKNKRIHYDRNRKTQMAAQLLKIMKSSTKKHWCRPHCKLTALLHDGDTGRLTTCKQVRMITPINPAPKVCTRCWKVRGGSDQPNLQWRWDTTMPETRATVYQALSLFCNSFPPATAFWSKYWDHSPTHGCTEAPDHLGLIMENKMFFEMNSVRWAAARKVEGSPSSHSKQWLHQRTQQGWRDNTESLQLTWHRCLGSNTRCSFPPLASSSSFNKGEITSCKCISWQSQQCRSFHQFWGKNKTVDSVPKMQTNFSIRRRAASQRLLWGSHWFISLPHQTKFLEWKTWGPQDGGGTKGRSFQPTRKYVYQL